MSEPEINAPGGIKVSVTEPTTRLPELPENAPPEEKDLYWYKHFYQGDKQRQLTFRAVLTGGLLGMFMSISNLYTTLKLGWSFGVAITACVLSYVIWNGLRALTRNWMTQMSMLETNCMQSTASAAGYSTGSTIGTAFGALDVAHSHKVPYFLMTGSPAHLAELEANGQFHLAKPFKLADFLNAVRDRIGPGNGAGRN